MKQYFRWGAFLCGVSMALGMGFISHASSLTIKEGIYADQDSLAGMTQEEAETMIREKVAKMGDSKITLVAAGGHEVTVTADELGIFWANSELVQEAVGLGTEGNVIQRYKAIKDLQFHNVTYNVDLEYDVNAINEVLISQCAKYDQKPVDASLTKVGNEFQITEGSVGYELDVEVSIDSIYDYLEHSWDGKDCRIMLSVAEEHPRGSAADLAEITDVLGSFTTSYKTSNANRSGNVANGCSKINGTLLYPGDVFSATETVSPFTKANGYAMAGAYLNGKVVDSMGGGICQVSSTLYNAVLLAELEVLERNPHSMSVTYVDLSADAAIAEGAGKDFRFRNNLDYPIYIEGVTKDKMITFTIYGKDVRPKNRKICYVSETLETIKPTVDLITADASKPIGYVSADTAHIGYKARLWKIVTVDDKEVSREVVNNSKYNVSPRRAVVGVATDEAWKHEEIMAAIGTNDLEHVKVVIGLLQAQ